MRDAASANHEREAMSMRPDSPFRLAVWLVLVKLIADSAGLPQEITAPIAIVFTVFSGWLIIRKRKSEGANTSGSRSRHLRKQMADGNDGHGIKLRNCDDLFAQ